MVAPFMLGHTTMSAFLIVMLLTADTAMGLTGFTASTDIVRVITDIVHAITTEAGGAIASPTMAGGDAVGKDRAGETRAHRGAAGVALDRGGKVAAGGGVVGADADIIQLLLVLRSMRKTIMPGRLSIVLMILIALLTGESPMARGGGEHGDAFRECSAIWRNVVP